MSDINFDKKRKYDTTIMCKKCQDRKIQTTLLKNSVIK